MTRRAIIIGMTCSVLLCCVTYFNQAVIRQSAIVGGYIPLSVYGPLILLLVAINPLLKRTAPRWRLSNRELVVVLAMVLAACGVAESGFLRGFTNVVMLTNHHRRTNPSWNAEKTGTFSRLPEHMRAQPGANDDALNGFLQGKPPSQPITPDLVPWRQWTAPLLTWLPLVFLLIIAFTALSLVVHRQWSQNEKLPYPLAAFTQELLGTDCDGTGSVLRDRAFWIATGIVFGIHMINFAHAWWPDYVIPVTTRFSMQGLARIIPFYEQAPLGGALLNCQVYFSVIGVAYLVATDVSFSFAAIPFFGVMALGILKSRGISFHAGGEHRASIYTSLNIGSFLGFLVMVAYFGRHHYRAVIRRALGFAPAESDAELLPHEIWGARVFAASSLLCILLMIAYGLPWPFAILYMGMIITFYVGISRVVAQTGLFIMKPAWVPHIFLLGLFGNYSLGPTAALIAMIFSAILFAEAREAVMPNIVNALNLMSRQDDRPPLGRVAAWSAAAAIVGLSVGLVVMLYLQYAHGTDRTSGWFYHHVPSYPVAISTGIAQQLESQGQLEASDGLGPLQRLAASRPQPKFLVSAIVGFVLVVGCYIGRIRIKTWPFNPAVLLLWSWYHCAKLAFSFLIGWMIKAGVTRYGGWNLVQKMRPIMIGFIAGDVFGAFVPAGISAIYYVATGKPPGGFNMMP